MAIDFDANRVNELFKDDNKTELKEGITAREINSVLGMTPPGRTDLLETLQGAYKLITDKSKVETNKYLGDAKPMENFKPQTPQLNQPVAKPSKTLAEQMAEQKAASEVKTTENNPPIVQQNITPNENFMGMYEKIRQENAKLPALGAGAFTPQFQLEDKIEEMKNEISEKDKALETIKSERDEAINKLYELDNYHTERYKELNQKYEKVKEDTSKEVSDPNSEFVTYLKERIKSLEQKENLLHEEIGKYKSMLGI